MMKRSLTDRTQRGDTIVEVLIAIAVVSLVLATGYAITNRNLATTQDTQEHDQAQQVVQRQIEELRATSAAGTLSTGFFNGSCIMDNAGTFSFISSVPNIPDGCSFVRDGTTGNCDPNVNPPCYKIEINKNPLGVYEINTQWDNVHGTKSSITMEYGV